MFFTHNLLLLTNYLPKSNFRKATIFIINLLWIYFFCNRPKHPTKVHVWAGISSQGKTLVIIFEGKMNGAGYIQVLEAGLIPYMRTVHSSPRFIRNTRQLEWDIGWRIIMWIGGRHFWNHLTWTPLRTYGMKWKSTFDKLLSQRQSRNCEWY